LSEIELHRKLLGDAVRNRALHEALKRAIKPGVTTVADLGAGTGFLSFLARKLGAKHCHLYEYSGALALAKKLASLNRVAGLTFVRAHSTEVRRPPKVDLVVAEILGNYALEEGLIETLADAPRFLKPGGRIIPHRLKQFVAPVTRARLQESIDAWPAASHGLDFAAAREIALNNMYVRTVTPNDLAGKGAGQAWDRMEFGPGAEPPSSVRTSGVSWPADEIDADAVHGFALWWEAELVPGVVLSTSPHAPPTHWQQIYLPLLAPVEIRSGETLEVALTSDTRPAAGVRVVWEAGVRSGGKLRNVQRQDTARGRL